MTKRGMYFRGGGNSQSPLLNKIPECGAALQEVRRSKYAKAKKPKARRDKRDPIGTRKS
jgi:hypothetical protein